MKDIKTFKEMLLQLLYILDNRQRKKAGVVFLFIIIGALFETLGVSIVLPFVQMLTSPDLILNNSFIRLLMSILGLHSAIEMTLFCGGAIIVVYVIKNLVIAFSGYMQVKYRANLGVDLQSKMMESYMNRPYQFFINHDSGYILRGLGGDVSGVQNVIEQLMRLCMETLNVIFIGIYAFYTDALMAIIIIIIAFLCLLFVVLVVKKTMSQLGRLNRSAAAEGSKVAVEIVQGIKDIFVRQKRNVFLDKYVKACIKTKKAQVGYQFVALLPERIIETICISGIIIVVMLRISWGVNNDEFIPKLAIFAVAAFRIMPSISRITGYINAIIYSRSMVEAAYEDIRQAHGYLSSIGKNILLSEVNEKSIRNFKDTIRVNNIFWRYENSVTDVLSGLSMVVHKGESVGIIGESGAGKSTLSDILLGLYQPQEGEILIDGYNLFDIPRAWAKIMGYVPQTIFLVDDTIRANVAFGEENVDEEAVWDALEQASMKSYVQSLPAGINTIVGERGLRFSGGQRQRIAIARALYSKPDILILDEATSALDNETELAVMESIECLQGKITTIIIAHRLTTICNCDRIYKISNGKACVVNKSDIVKEAVLNTGIHT